MSEMLTKSAARNIFYGGTIFFFVIFIGLVVHSVNYATTVSANTPITASVERGKKVWEKHSCINCHTIIGEGAYFAPEVGNVFVRYGGDKDPKAARDAIKAWMKAQPSGVPGRRQMPQFNLSEQELDDLVDFFAWTNKIKTQDWPPNKAG
jgi:nitric oxide reductase subunit C